MPLAIIVGQESMRLLLTLRSHTSYTHHTDTLHTNTLHKHVHKHTRSQINKTAQDPSHASLANLLRAEVTIQHSALLKYHLVSVCSIQCVHDSLSSCALILHLIAATLIEQKAGNRSAQCTHLQQPNLCTRSLPTHTGHHHLQGPQQAVLRHSV